MPELRHYAKFATDFVSNNVFDRPRLSVLMFYGTSACNSRCKTCNIWQKPVEHMSLEVVRRALAARCVSRRTRIGFEGGEFLLNPERDAILAHAAELGFDVLLLSNGLMPERLAETVTRHGIRRVHISLDGPRETYARVRGLDAYEKVVRSIELIRDRAEVAVLYLVNPWNGHADLRHVVSFCQHKGLDLRIGIYHDMEWFETDRDASEMDADLGSLDLGPFAPENQAYLELYEGWRNGEVRLPCFSIRQVMVVYPNGDVPLCQSKHQILGSLKQQSLDEILGAQQTIELQRSQRGCNQCWIGFHRKLEVMLYRKLEFLPVPLLRRLLGDYALPPRRSAP